MAKASAPAKVHLIGEHVVVYGEPAILAAVGKRCFVSAAKNGSDKLRVTFRDNYKTECTVKDAISLGIKADKLWEEGNAKGDFSGLFGVFKEDRKRYATAYMGKAMKELEVSAGMDFDMWTEIPVGSGLGSSSAYSVALVKAIAEESGKKLSAVEVNELAFKLEQYAHGRPSGGDNSACAFGGLIWFKKNMQGGKPEIKPLEAPRLENFVLVYTGKPEKTTGELVQMVAKLPAEVREPRVRAIGAMVPGMLEAIQGKDYKKVRGIINSTWDNLKALGL